jgi:ribose 5-phosphate isomerase A
MDETARAAAKRHAGRSAAGRVDDGAVVGLGTGSTAATAIRALGEHVDAGLDITGVPTSYQSRAIARRAGVPLGSLEDHEQLDIAIDGADQVVGGTLVKGGGGAHALEKVIAEAAEHYAVVVDESKLAETLDHAVPVAILPEARATAAAAVRRLGGEPTLRAASEKVGPVVTDQGHLVLDCAFGAIEDPAALAASLSSVPGIVEHGLFVDQADVIHVGRSDGAAVRDL